MAAKSWLVTRFKSYFEDNLFVQNIAVVAGGTGVAKAIGIFTTPIITRIYSPDDFGVFSLLISITGVLGAISTLRYAIPIAITRSDYLAESLLKLCFLTTLTICIFLVLTLFFLDFFQFRIGALEKIQPFLWFVPAVFMGKGMYDALNNWALREKRFRLITGTRFSQSLSSSITKISLGTLGLVPLGLFIGQVAQDFGGVGRYFFQLIKANPQFFKRLDWESIAFVAKRYKRFPLIQSWSQLLLAFGAQLPVFLIAFYYGAETVGVFGLALAMINVPLDLLGQSVAQVYFAEISKYSKSEPSKVYRLSLLIIKKMFWIALLPTLVLIFFGPWLFKTVFGAEWLEAGVYARFLSLMTMTRFLASPIASAFNVYEKQVAQLLLNSFRVLLIFSIFAIADFYSFSSISTIVTYSGSMVFYYLATILFLLLSIRNKITKNSEHEKI